MLRASAAERRYGVSLLAHQVSAQTLVRLHTNGADLVGEALRFPLAGSVFRCQQHAFFVVGLCSFISQISCSVEPFSPSCGLRLELIS